MISETERRYEWWLERFYPKESERRANQREHYENVLKSLDSAYKKPVIEPFRDFNPSAAFIKEVIKGLSAAAYVLLKQKQKAKADPDLSLTYPHLEVEHVKVLNQIKFLKHRLALYNKTGNWLSTDDGRITDEQKERAKSRPITDFYSGKLRKAGGRLYGRCPFHNEKTGSFVIYESQNTYHCYGCEENGDVINYIMKAQNLNFIEAVKYLLQ